MRDGPEGPSRGFLRAVITKLCVDLRLKLPPAVALLAGDDTAEHGALPGVDLRVLRLLGPALPGQGVRPQPQQQRQQPRHHCGPVSPQKLPILSSASLHPTPGVLHLQPATFHSLINE